MKELYKENLWNKIYEEVNALKHDESMQKFFNKNVLNFSNLTDSITYLMSNKLINDDMPEGNIIDYVREAFLDNGILIEDDKKVLNLRDFKDKCFKLSYGKKKHYLIKII